MLYEERPQMIQKLDQAQILRLFSLEIAQQSLRSDFKESRDIQIEEIISRALQIDGFLNGSTTREKDLAKIEEIIHVLFAKEGYIKLDDFPFNEADFPSSEKK